ncbi:MAG: CRISPR-associated endonuclease Cas1 [Candidatus Bipolaricaulota bacterium]|nr:CRISPR-associated endonuclease Cas1 [Candidatus Bipolaricaulota bacterium]MCX7844900.1 CRISPR-associated endonuclease Cas1 [Candidatus Bipolaricaulota bacterium]MDW8151801.1 CRISPR-associated endonuclease Cas1 [Candidatus Bipolaricaulota bacterium]
MSALYVLEDGAVLRKEGAQVVVVGAKAGVLLKMPLEQVEEIVVVGNATVTAPLVAELLARGIGLAYFSRSGEFLGRLVPETSKNVPLRWAQFRAAADSRTALALARAMVKGKILNQRTLLMRAAREGVPDLAAAIEDLKLLAERVERAQTLDELRGLEGAASARYFREWPKLLRRVGFRFPGRVRRPPTDPVNAMLSFGYTLLANLVFAACHVVGFDPYVGYLHMDRWGRPALVLDLMEELRPVLVDSLVLALIHRDQVAPEGFETGLGGACRMDRATLRTFLQAWEERRRTLVRHPLLQQEVPYFRVPELQARILAKVLLGEAEEYVPFLTR